MDRSNSPTAPHLVIVVDGEREKPEWVANGTTLLTVERRDDEPVIVGGPVKTLPHFLIS